MAYNEAIIIAGTQSALLSTVAIRTRQATAYSSA